MRWFYFSLYVFEKGLKTIRNWLLRLELIVVIIYVEISESINYKLRVVVKFFEISNHNIRYFEFEMKNLFLFINWKIFILFNSKFEIYVSIE